MKEALIVVDMQNDFIDGILGTPEAVSIVPRVLKKVKDFRGLIFFTQDTHGEDYLRTEEGKNLPLPHCIRGTHGWKICDALLEDAQWHTTVHKEAFGSYGLAQRLARENERSPIEQVTLVGLCTDICVISNAMMIKAVLPNAHIVVDSSCCAGTTLESHLRALKSMQTCHIEVV